MSTLNSTNMTVTRPTTKVRYAPGGQTSINLSFDEQPVGKGGFKPTFDPSPELSAEPVQEQQEEKPKPAAPTENGVVSATTTVAPTPVTTTAPVEDAAGAGVSVGLVFASSSPVNEALKARTIEVLHARGVTDISVLTVHDVLQLPFGAKQLVSKGNVQAVIALAALTEEVWASREVASAVVSGIVQLSLEQTIPVVPGFVYAVSEKEASTKVTDVPSAWVSSALSLVKFDVETVAPTTSNGVVKEVASPAKPAPAPVAEKTVEKADKVAARPPGAVDSTPVRATRGRGAGPSSIVFG